MSWWDLTDNKEQEQQPDKIVKDQIRYDKFLEKSYLIIEKLDDICFRLPEEKEQVRIITQLRFNAFALLKWIVENIEEIEEIIITTYRTDRMTLKGIQDIVAKQKSLKKLTIVSSAFFTSIKKPEIWAEELKEYAIRNDKVKVIFCRNHTKVIGVKGSGKHYIIEGSGNLTGNARVEQYTVERDKNVFEFHKYWIDSLKEKPKHIDIYGAN